MESLPNEILVAIFEYLPRANRIISLVCKDWHALANICRIGNNAYLRGYSLKYMLEHVNICDYMMASINPGQVDKIVNWSQKKSNKSKHAILQNAIRCKNYKFVKMLQERNFSVRVTPCSCLREIYLQNYHLHNERLSTWDVRSIVAATGCGSTSPNHKKYIRFIILSGIDFEIGWK